MTDKLIEQCISIVEEQQLKLRFEKLNYDDAFALGNYVVETAKENYSKPVAVRIDVEGVTAFYCLMEGTGLNNDWWMKKKLGGCQKTGESSFMNFLKIRAAGRDDEFPWSKNESSFAVVGGCFPLCLRDGNNIGYLMVSGLPHQQDHQLIVDSLSGFLGIDVSSVLGIFPRD